MSRPRAWEKRLRPLMETPGKWELMREYESSERAVTDASHLRHGRLSCPPGRWEFYVNHAHAEYGIFDLLARYLGPDEQAAS